MIQDPLITIVPSPRNLEENQKLIKLLEMLPTVSSEYPPELLKPRRAAFIVQVEQRLRSTSQVMQPFAK